MIAGSSSGARIEGETVYLFRPLARECRRLGQQHPLRAARLPGQPADDDARARADRRLRGRQLRRRRHPRTTARGRDRISALRARRRDHHRAEGRQTSNVPVRIAHDRSRRRHHRGRSATFGAPHDLLGARGSRRARTHLHRNMLTTRRAATRREDACRPVPRSRARRRCFVPHRAARRPDRELHDRRASRAETGREAALARQHRSHRVRRALEPAPRAEGALRRAHRRTQRAR